MNRKMSLIDNSLVDENTKRLLRGEVSRVIEFPQKNMDAIFNLVPMKYHIAPAVFRNNVKKQSEIILIDFLCMDFDSGVTIEDISNRFRDYYFYVLGSKNHLKDKGDGNGIRERFHIFFPFSEAVTSPELYKYIFNMFSLLVKSEVDKSSIDPSRYYFRHSSLIKINNGDFINVEILKDTREKMVLSDKIKSMFTKPINKIRPVNIDKDIINKGKPNQISLKECLGNLANEGERYTNICTATGYLKKRGMSEAEVSSLLLSHMKINNRDDRIKAENVIKGLFRK